MLRNIALIIELQREITVTFFFLIAICGFFYTDYNIQRIVNEAKI